MYMQSLGQSKSSSQSSQSEAHHNMEVDESQPPEDFASIYRRLSMSRCSLLSALIPQNFHFRALSSDSVASELSQDNSTKEKKPKIGQGLNNEDSRFRIYFTSYASIGESYVMTLLCSDLDLNNEVNLTKEMYWKPLIGEEHVELKENISLAEKLMRERMRQSSSGVTSFEVDNSTGRVVYPIGGELFTLMDEGRSMSLQPQKVDLASRESPIRPTMCPHNPDIVAYVSEADIWCAHIPSRKSDRLTTASVQDKARGAGMPTFVIQEEFDRYVGFWWQPKTSDDNVYRILYEEYDEKEVEIIKIMRHTSAGQDVEEYRYPKPGKKNAKSDLKLVEFVYNDFGEIVQKSFFHLPRPLLEVFPEYEYLVRAGWTPDAKYVWCQLLNRVQTKLGFFLIPVDQFRSAASSPEETSRQLKVIHLLTEEQPDFWVNVYDYLTFLTSSDDNGEAVEFIWGSDRTGFRHLFHLRRSWRAHELATAETSTRCTVNAKDEFTEQLSAGNWDIKGPQIWVSEKHKFVFFLGLKEHSLKANLYAAPYGPSRTRSPFNPILLTKDDPYDYDASLDTTLGIGVIKFSCVFRHIKAHVVQLVFGGPDEVSLREVGLHRQAMSHEEVMATTLNPMKPPQLLQMHMAPHAKDGSASQDGPDPWMYGLLFTPNTPPPDSRGYPCVHYVYGGPSVQLVNLGYNRNCFFKAQVFCHYGYAFLMCDNRGSCNRGMKFAGHVKYNLGQVELEEQVTFLKNAAEVCKNIDLTRVAIYGWSYGGYMALMGMAQFSDVYRLGVAGAPVVDWHLYDTGYTERYIGLPQDHTDAYKQGNVLTHVSGFPSESNRLLIAHGGQDENVHIYNTSLLLHEMAKLGRPYQLLFYPTSRHRVNFSDHLEASILAFLENNLKRYGRSLC